MEKLLLSSVVADLRRCKTQDELVKSISSVLQHLESACAANPVRSEIKSAIFFLVEVDVMIDSLTVTFDPHILLHSWKRLISFFKSYSHLVSSMQANLLLKVLNHRSRYHIRSLCSWHNTCSSINDPSEHLQNHAFMLSNLQPLIFYSQRISASMAYFSSIIEDAISQSSMENMFYLRGFLSILQFDRCEQLDRPSDLVDYCCKSEEYFRKALRPPSDVSVGMRSRDGECDINSGGKMQSCQNGDVTSTSQEISSADRNLSMSIFDPVSKFKRAVNHFIRPTSDVTGIDALNYSISVGACQLACFELEKLPLNLKLHCNAEYGARKVQQDFVHPALQCLTIFLSTIERVCGVHNSRGSDAAIVSLQTRLLNALLDYLEFIGSELEENIASAAVTAIFCSMIAVSCNGSGRSATKALIARHLLGKVLERASFSSQRVVAEALWGVHCAACETARKEPISAHTHYVGHLKGIALTMRRMLLTVSLEVAHSLLLKIATALCLYSSLSEQHKEQTAANTILLRFEHLIRFLPLTALIKRCKDHTNNSSGTGDVQKREGGQGHPPVCDTIATSTSTSSSTFISESERVALFNPEVLLNLIAHLLTQSCVLMTSLEQCSTLDTAAGETGIRHSAALRMYVGASIISTLDAKRSLDPITIHSNIAHSPSNAKCVLLRYMTATAVYMEGLAVRASASSFSSNADLDKYGRALSAFEGLLKGLQPILDNALRLKVPPSQISHRHSADKNSGASLPLIALTNLDIVTLMKSAQCMLLTSGNITQALSTISLTESTSIPTTLDSSVSLILKSVKCSCVILDLILHHSTSISKAVFDFVKNTDCSMIQIVLSLTEISEKCSTFHPGAAISSNRKGIALSTGMKIVGVWSTLLASLVAVAKSLPPSYRSSIPTLVPSKALILVQAASRASTASVVKVIRDVANVPCDIPVLVTMQDEDRWRVAHMLHMCEEDVTLDGGHINGAHLSTAAASTSESGLLLGTTQNERGGEREGEGEQSIKRRRVSPENGPSERIS